MIVLSVGDYFHNIASGDDLPNISEEVNAACKKRYRRIDRFIQLSLLGSARCLKDQSLDANDSLCITSGLASMSNTIKVQQQMFIDRQPPKPANFINSLSNAAGFFVASNLGLHGKNIFVARKDQSLDAALTLSAIEIAAQPQRKLLLGAIDECPLPLAQHRVRMGLAENTALCEGSHWLLLADDSHTGGIARITKPVMLHSLQALQVYLSEQGHTFSHVCVHGRQYFQDNLATLFSSYIFYDDDRGEYGVRSAGLLATFLTDTSTDNMLFISADKWGRYEVFTAKKL